MPNVARYEPRNDLAVLRVPGLAGAPSRSSGGPAIGVGRGDGGLSRGRPAHARRPPASGAPGP